MSIKLKTGRTHQIRVQFASRRHPLKNDRRYGSKTTGAMALWASGLTLDASLFCRDFPEEREEPWVLFQKELEECKKEKR